MLQLVEPSIDYKEAMLDAAQEMYDVGEWDITPDALAVQFEDILNKILTAKNQATTPPGVLPYEDFWLLDGSAWIGLLTLRQRIDEHFMRRGGHIGYVIRPSRRRRGYGTMLLRLGLAKARAYGIPRVLLTCDDANVGSWKVIEANGGRLENSIVIERNATSVLTRRYWIDLTADSSQQSR